jgi:gamma-glutamylcysteine synthetase
MDPHECLQRVGGLFPRDGRRTTRIAIEHELLTADSATGSVVPIGRVRAAVEGASYASYLGFEPGGQVELSLPTAACPGTLASGVSADLAALRAACAASGIRLHARPVDPRDETEVPRQLLSPRYVAMERHFDTIGPAGRVMMRRTASTQVCLDWWPGAAGLEQWRVLNLAAPFVAAAFARSTGPGSRLATWLAVDPGRTAFDGRLLAGEDPVAAYTDFALGATCFAPSGGVTEHLTTLFPPVRPRGRYLEVRFPDVQEDRTIGSLVTVLARLVHDDDIREAAMRLLAGEQALLDQHWYDAAHGRGEVLAVGIDLVALTGAAPLVGAA